MNCETLLNTQTHTFEVEVKIEFVSLFLSEGVSSGDQLRYVHILIL